MNKKSILKDVALLACGILIGTGIGYAKIAPFLTWLTMSKTGDGMGWYAEAQYYKATVPAALKAQNEYLAYLAAVERNKPEWNNWSVPWTTVQLLNYDRAITYARIAILEGREGKATDAEKSWLQAEKAATDIGWKNPTREHILKIVNTKEAEFRKSEERAQPGQ
jgi:hypothetical protein